MSAVYTEWTRKVEHVTCIFTLVAMFVSILAIHRTKRSVELVLTDLDWQSKIR